MSDGVVIALAVALAIALAVTVSIIVGLSRRLSLTRRRLQDTVVARDTLLARDQDIAINASHRLRTPITALRLSLEDLSHWPETAPGVAAELRRSIAEIDRWDEAVGHILGEAHGSRLQSASDVDLAALAERFVRDHAPGARPRELTYRTKGPVPARVDPSVIDRILTMLLDHLLAHGAGAVRLDVAAHPSHLHLRLADGSPRTLPPGVVRLGEPCLGHSALGEAGALAESLGGYVAVEDRSTTRFLVLLPVPASGGAEGASLG